MVDPFSREILLVVNPRVHLIEEFFLGRYMFKLIWFLLSHNWLENYLRATSPPLPVLPASLPLLPIPEIFFLASILPVYLP